MPAAVTVEDQRRRRFLENSDRVDDADLFQREDVLAGRRVDAEGAGVRGEGAVGNEVPENGGIVLDRTAPVLAGKQISGIGGTGGGGETEVFGEEAEIGGFAGPAANGDDDGESRGEDEDGEGE